MNNEENQNTRSDQEVREERVLALLLDELNAEEAKSIEDLLAHDADLRAYRDRLEQTLDLVAESARAKADLDSDTFRLDPQRRQVLEKLWTDDGTDHETEESEKTIPFESVTEPVESPRGKLGRFLPMAAAAVVTVGAMGVIVSSLNEQTKHEENMALATQDAFESTSDRNSVPMSTSASAFINRGESMQELVGQNEEDAPNDINQIPSDKFDAEVSQALDLKVSRDSNAILDRRLVTKIDELNGELSEGFNTTTISDTVTVAGVATIEELPPAKNPMSNRQAKEHGLKDLDLVGGGLRPPQVAFGNEKGKTPSPTSDLELGDKEPNLGSTSNLPVGTIHSFLEAELIDKQTASASGGVSAAGAGLLVPQRSADPNTVTKSKTETRSKRAASDPSVVSADPGFVGGFSYESADKPLNQAHFQTNPTGERLAVSADDDLREERESLTRTAILDFSKKAPVPSSGPTGQATVDENKREDDYSAIRRGDVSDLVSPGKRDGKLSPSMEGSLATARPRRSGGVGGGGGRIVAGKDDSRYFPSVHDELGAAPGAVAGEKGAKKNLLAFADFGLGGKGKDRNGLNSHELVDEDKGRLLSDQRKRDGEENSRSGRDLLRKNLNSGGVVDLNEPSDLPVFGVAARISNGSGLALTVDGSVSATSISKSKTPLATAPAPIISSKPTPDFTPSQPFPFSGASAAFEFSSTPAEPASPIMDQGQVALNESLRLLESQKESEKSGKGKEISAGRRPSGLDQKGQKLDPFAKDGLSLAENKALDSIEYSTEKKSGDKVKRLNDSTAKYDDAKPAEEKIEFKEGASREGESDEESQPKNSERDSPTSEDISAVPPAVATEPKPEFRSVDQPYSTFSLNVSDVSLRLAEAALKKGQWPAKSTIRSEEFVNAFDYRDPLPAEGQRLAFRWERARHPFAHDREVLRFSVKAAATGRKQAKPLNLVLLLDNSGSMERADRVALIQKSLLGLSKQLTNRDRVSLVSFARRARLRIDNLPGDKLADAVRKLGELVPEGGTNIEEALDLAYATARKRYLPKGGNRVILLTDGAANLGELAPLSLKGKVEDQRRRGIALDCFGIGWDGYEDHMLETLSRNGDGRYAFLNDLSSVDEMFSRKLAGALRPAAADLKVQIEFNPERVELYRQVGFEKHQLKKEYFRDNSIDAAEIAAAEAGNALYVVKVNPRGKGDLGVFRIRYKEPETGDYKEREWPLAYRREVVAFADSSSAMRLAVHAASFAEWLSESPYGAGFESEEAEADLRVLRNEFPEEAPVDRLSNMIGQARSISR
jgi:Mg-chelatase subunit ChlD